MMTILAWAILQAERIAAVMFSTSVMFLYPLPKIKVLGEFHFIEKSSMLGGASHANYNNKNWYLQKSCWQFLEGQISGDP